MELMEENVPVTVWAHALRLQEDVLQRGPLADKALRGLSNQECLIAEELPADGPYCFAARDDLDTVVVVGPLPDLLRCLRTCRLRAPHYTKLTIPRESKLEPMFHPAGVVVALAADKMPVDGHPIDRWGQSFPIMDIGFGNHLYCFPGTPNAQKIDMAIFLLVLLTLLRGSPPHNPLVVVRDAIHRPGSSVPIGQVYEDLLLEVQEDLTKRRPLRLISNEERSLINPNVAYGSYKEVDLDRLADALSDREGLCDLLTQIIGADWEVDKPYLPDFLTSPGIYG